MRLRDFLTLSGSAVGANRMRSFLTSLGIAIGIAAVILLTSIGEGVHNFVLAEFTQFGTNIVGITPGKTTTHGGSVGMFGTDRPLTIDDAIAIGDLSLAEGVVPIVRGNAEVEAGRRQRRTSIYGVGGDFTRVFSINVNSGRFLPDDDPTAPRALVVLGSKVRQELFPDSSPLGRRLRIGGSGYRIIGVMESKGQILGFDLDDTVYLPAERALELFNREGLMEIDVLYSRAGDVDRLVGAVKRLLIARHGKEDFTITTQEQMLDVLGSVLDMLTIAVGAIGSISLLVGGIGIVAIMTISVTERTSEIGLLRAIGGRKRQIMALFLGEATVLSAAGGVAGLTLGYGLARVLSILVPALPVHTPVSYVLLAEILAIGIGLVAGLVPAYRAANLDPVEALHTE